MNIEDLRFIYKFIVHLILVFFFLAKLRMNIGLPHALNEDESVKNKEPTTLMPITEVVLIILITMTIPFENAIYKTNVVLIAFPSLVIASYVPLVWAIFTKKK